MRKRGEWRTALALLPAIAGMGLCSGRATALFFGQFGPASWVGVMTASAMFGTLIAGAVWRGQSCKTSDGLASACETMRMLMAAITAAVMLACLGDTGALILPLRHSYAFGATFGALAALVIAGIRRRWILGMAQFVLLGGFFAACAMDVRPVCSFAGGDVEFPLFGNCAAALYFAALFAAMNACAAAWSLKPEDTGGLRPVRLGFMSAALLLALLPLANLALLRGGDVVLALPMPWVSLSARWGLAGFWLCAVMKALCATTTLSAALSMLLSRLHRQRSMALCMLACAIILFGVLSWSKLSANALR